MTLLDEVEAIMEAEKIVGHVADFLAEKGARVAELVVETPAAHARVIFEWTEPSVAGVPSAEHP